MAPAFQAVGTAVSSTGASVSPAWPTHLTNDIGLVVIETSGNSANLTPPAGWAAIPGTPVTAVATTAGSKLHVWWKRAASAAEAAVATGAATDHIVARLFTFRGCVTTGNPWNVTTTGTKTTASTTATVPALTTTLDDLLITMIVGRPDDTASTTHFGVPVNANLTGLAERGEAGTTSGNGGGFVLSTGVDALPGDTGTSTLTKTVSTTDTYVVLALKAQTELIHTVGTFALAGTTTGLLETSVIHGTTQTYSVVGNDADFSKSVSLDISAGNFTYDGTTTGLLFNRNLIQQFGAFSLAGVNTILLKNSKLDTSVGTYTLAGTTTTIAFNRALVGQTGPFTLAGVNVDLTYIPVSGTTFTLDIQTGDLIVAGVISNIDRQYLLGITASSFSVAGVQIGLIASRRLDAITGSVVLTGQLAAFNRQFLLDITKGTFTFSGVSSEFNRQFQLDLQRKVFNFDGSAVGLTSQRLLNTTKGEFNVFYVPSELRRSFPLLGNTGSFNVGSAPLDYFATRTLNATTLNLLVYVQTRDIVYRPNRQPTLPTPVPTGRNQWILGKFSSGGKGSFRV